MDTLGTPRTAGLALWSGARTRVGFAIGARALAYTRRVHRSDARRPIYMRDAFLELATYDARNSRKEPGCLRFDVQVAAAVAQAFS